MDQARALYHIPRKRRWRRMAKRRRREVGRRIKTDTRSSKGGLEDEEGSVQLQWAS